MVQLQRRSVPGQALQEGPKNLVGQDVENGSFSVPVRALENDFDEESPKTKRESLEATRADGGTYRSEYWRTYNYRDKHVIRRIDPETDYDNAYSSCLNFLFQLAKRNCRQPSGTARMETKCHCLYSLSCPGSRGFLSTEVRGCARYMVHWKGLNNAEKKKILAEWYKASEAGDGKYLLPWRASVGKYAYGSVTPSPLKICKNALLAILDVGRKMWVSIKCFDGKVGKHSNKSASFLRICYPSLKAFFEKHLEIGKPSLTCVELPSSYSKKMMYEKFLFEQGYVADKERKTKGYMVKLGDLKSRTDKPWLEEGRQPGGICSLTTFMKYWERDYPNLAIKPKAKHS